MAYTYKNNKYHQNLNLIKKERKKKNKSNDDN